MDEQALFYLNIVGNRALFSISVSMSFIMNDIILRNEIIDKPIGQMRFDNMKIGKWESMCQCREFVAHLLEFKYYKSS